jgi:hypothetical protein
MAVRRVPEVPVGLARCGALQRGGYRAPTTQIGRASRDLSQRLHKFSLQFPFVARAPREAYGYLPYTYTSLYGAMVRRARIATGLGPPSRWVPRVQVSFYTLFCRSRRALPINLVQKGGFPIGAKRSLRVPSVHVHVDVWCDGATGQNCHGTWPSKPAGTQRTG